MVYLSSQELLVHIFDYWFLANSPSVLCQRSRMFRNFPKEADEYVRAWCEDSVIKEGVEPDSGLPAGYLPEKKVLWIRTKRVREIFPNRKLADWEPRRLIEIFYKGKPFYGMTTSFLKTEIFKQWKEGTLTQVEGMKEVPEYQGVVVVGYVPHSGIIWIGIRPYEEVIQLEDGDTAGRARLLMNGIVHHEEKYPDNAAKKLNLRQRQNPVNAVAISLAIIVLGFLAFLFASQNDSRSIEDVQTVVNGKKAVLDWDAKTVRILTPDLVTVDGVDVYAPMDFFLDTFKGFSPIYRPAYRLISEDVGVLTLEHSLFSPCGVWIVKDNKDLLFHILHSGRIHDVFPWNDGFALVGVNNKMNYQTVLVLTQPLVGRAGEGHAVVVANPDYFRETGLVAYHLLGNDVIVKQDETDNSVVVIGSDGETRRVLESGSIEGQGIDSGYQTLRYLKRYHLIQDSLFKNLLTSGSFEDQQRELDQLVDQTESERLEGYSVLFGSLQAKALVMQDKYVEARDKCLELHEEFPSYGMDLTVQAGLYMYLAGDYEGAIDLWVDARGDPLIARSHRIYTLITFSSMILDTDKARARIDGFIKAIPEHNFWREYLTYQKGWLLLLQNRPEDARQWFKGVLSKDGMEEHATGYFLSKILTGSFSEKEFKQYAKSDNAPQELPLCLRWVEAVGRGNTSEAQRQWNEMEKESRYQTELMMMYPLLKKVRLFYSI